MSVDAAAQLVSLQDIRRAAERIGDLALRTPVVELPHPDRPDDVLHCKAESLQPTGAFKIRGASNAILQVLETTRENGVVAQSSGNHARAVAWLAHRLGLRAVIVMPDVAPAPKIAAVRALGAEVELVPAAQRDTRARELAADRGGVHVPPYDDLRVIAGQGTVGLELLEQVADVDVVLVPVSGGGLISGVSTAVKAISPDTRVVGVEPELAADAAESLRRGSRVTWTPEQTYRTVADGLRTTSLGVHTWEHVQRYVDDIVTVSEEQMLAAMRHLALGGRLVAEPSGAAAVAAWMHDLVPAGARVAAGSGAAAGSRVAAGSGAAAGPWVAAVVSGGSVDPALLASVLERGE
ncbi:threonine ammonia-lyase [Arthrobacter castelli]|uniref:threonine ammonia-lyase n=1 Tax=Arthrobacter castelli TaxID=271431 RepID=UPI000406ECD5|nr:threonine/serine dehydratase [Arthrobacter castelli]